MTQVRTRFAPSPTGALHIGGARTALFAQVFAHGQGGQFLIRVEDTDKERSTDENKQQIEQALAWLGLESDEPAVFQSENIDAHKAAVEKLLADSNAYEDDGAIRFKMPVGDFTLEDAVQGTVTFPADSPNLKDWVIQRSDGTPTYNLAVTIDDHDMGISHVLRGDDHLNNTAKQIALWQALYPQDALPVYAHVPMIHGADGGKMSKRHGATSVLAYRDEGYLPQALANYLLKLGWQGVPDTDVFTKEQAGKCFALEQLSKAPSTYDVQKLNWLNQQYLQNMTSDDLLSAVTPFLPNTPSAEQQQWLTAGLPDLAQRAATLVELAAGCDFYLTNSFDLDEKGTAIMAEGGAERAKTIADSLENVTEWDIDTLKQTFQDILATQGWKFKDLGQACRLALMGRLNGPDLAGVMVVLGQAETLKRLRS